MKRKILVGILSALVIISVVGCGGIPQADYDALMAERDAAQSKAAALESEVIALEGELAASVAPADYDAVIAERDAALDEVAELEAELEEALAAEAVPEVPVSFEAAEYVNEEYGISVKYLMEWSVYPAEALSMPLIFLAGLGSWYTPGCQIGIIDVAEGDTLTDIIGIVNQDEGAVAGPESQSTLADGTPVTVLISDSLYWDSPVVNYNLGLIVDDVWIVYTVFTMPALAEFDEVLYSEIAHTLKFE